MKKLRIRLKKAEEDREVGKYEEDQRKKKIERLTGTDTLFGKLGHYASSPKNN